MEVQCAKTTSFPNSWASHTRKNKLEERLIFNMDLYMESHMDSHRRWAAPCGHRPGTALMCPETLE